MAFKFDGLLFEIFSNLPAKAIFKFTTTCEAAHNLPSNDLFVKKQWVNMQSRHDLGFLLQNSFWSMKKKVELHPLIPDDAICYGLPSVALKFLSRTAHILASSNGLLFCLNKNEDRSTTDLFICNPATQSWVAVPTPDGLHISPVRMVKAVLDCSGNGDSSMDYNLMVLMKDPEGERFSTNLVLKMFSPKEGTWKEVGIIDHGNRDVAFYHMPLYDKSTQNLYILSDFHIRPSRYRKSPFFWPYIVACSMKNFPSTRYLKLPKDARKGLYSNDCKMDIFKWWKKGDVCMVQLSKGVFRVWALLQGDGKWVQILRMRALAMMGKCSQKEKDYFHVRGFTVLNGKSLLFATAYRVYLYDLKGHDQGERRKGKVGDEICEHDLAAAVTVDFHSYSSTLRPCGDGAMPLDQSP